MPDRFASREEEAEFWDTHDIAGYWHELKPVKLKLSDNLAHEVIIRFDSDTFKKVCKTASNRGVTPIALIRQWVVERLNEQ